RQAPGEATLLLLARAAEVVRVVPVVGTVVGTVVRVFGRLLRPGSPAGLDVVVGVAVAHDSPVTVFPRTISPGGRPVARSVSRACCRMSTAAALSTTARRLAPLLARSR